MSEADVDEGSSGTKLVVLGGLLGVAIGGGAAWYFAGGAQPADPNSPKAVVREAPKELISVAFERLVVPVYATRKNRRRLMGNYLIDANIQVDGETHQIAVKRSVAQIQHGFISAISKSELMKTESSRELDTDKLARVLKKKASEIMGPGVIEDVTITAAMLMPR
ncbi:MAG: hypothetical protein JKY34_00550 [Kordiimonadaceae bacterium]|nr:hypothetical protein [Kordiimonadaceae bacterium]